MFTDCSVQLTKTAIRACEVVAAAELVDGPVWSLGSILVDPPLDTSMEVWVVPISLECITLGLEKGIQYIHGSTLVILLWSLWWSERFRRIVEWICVVWQTTTSDEIHLVHFHHLQLQTINILFHLLFVLVAAELDGPPVHVDEILIAAVALL